MHHAFKKDQENTAVPACIGEPLKALLRGKIPRVPSSALGGHTVWSCLGM